MIHHRIDASFFLPILQHFTKDIILEVISYAYDVCHDCKHYTLREYTCVCGVIRCEYDSFINMRSYACIMCDTYVHNAIVKQNNIPYISCIIPQCDNPAEYGYKDIVCYCLQHAKNKKVIDYAWCSTCHYRTPYRYVIYKCNESNLVCYFHLRSSAEYELNYVKP